MPKRQPWTGLYSYQASKGLYYTKRDGKQYYAKTEEALWRKLQALDQPQEHLFKDVAKEWWAVKSEQVQETTLQGYRSPYDRAVDEYGNLPITDIKPAQIESQCLQMKAQGYAGKTIRAQHQTISMIFDFAVSRGYTDTNPSRVVRLPKNLPKTKRQAPSKDAVKIIKEHRNDENGLFPFLLLCTGLRRGEALALLWSDIDFRSNTITVSKEIVYPGGAIKVKTPKTEAGTRTVPLLQILRDVLRPMQPKRKKDVPIFQNEKGGYLSLSSVRRKWERYCTAVGIDLTPHQLRHGYATILYESGIDAKTAQHWLGHADIQTTLDIYTDLREQFEAEQAKRLSKSVKI